MQLLKSNATKLDLVLVSMIRLECMCTVLVCDSKLCKAYLNSIPLTAVIPKIFSPGLLPLTFV